MNHGDPSVALKNFNTNYSSSMKIVTESLIVQDSWMTPDTNAMCTRESLNQSFPCHRWPWVIKAVTCEQINWVKAKNKAGICMAQRQMHAPIPRSTGWWCILKNTYIMTDFDVCAKRDTIQCRDITKFYHTHYSGRRSEQGVWSNYDATTLFGSTLVNWEFILKNWGKQQ